MASPSLQRFHFVQVGSWLSARLYQSTGPFRDPFTRVWALGDTLEAGAWLCLGADLRYFPPAAVRAALEPVFTQPSGEAIRPILTTNALNWWTSALSSGNVAAALDARLFRDVATDMADTLHPPFQTASLWAQHFSSDEIAQRFMRTVRLATDSVWAQETGAQRRHMTEALGRGEKSRSLRALSDGGAWLFDGLLRAASHFEALVLWGVATVTTRPATPEHASQARERRDALGTARARLLLSAGSIERWRLDLGHELVRNRIEEMIAVAEELAEPLLEMMGGDPRSAWPNGIRSALQERFRYWATISGVDEQQQPPR